jgi:hypothetical protein
LDIQAVNVESFKFVDRPGLHGIDEIDG